MLFFSVGVALLAAAVFLLLIPSLKRQEATSLLPTIEKMDPIIAVIVLIGLFGATYLQNVFLFLTSLLTAWLVAKTRSEMVHRRSLEKLDDEFLPFLEYLSVIFSSTKNFVSSMEQAAENIKGPLADEIRETIREYRATNRLQLALQHLAERVPTWSMRFFVRSVIEAETFGADVSEVITPVIRTIKNREELRQELRTEIRAQQATVWVLLIMLPGILMMSLFVVPNSFHSFSRTLFGQLIVASIPLIEYLTWYLFYRLEREVVL